MSAPILSELVVHPGDWLGFDPECAWLVLAVDGHRVLCVDANDGFRGGWIESPAAPMPLNTERALERLSAMRRAAARLDGEAADLEMTARTKRAYATRLREVTELAERLAAATGGSR